MPAGRAPLLAQFAFRRPATFRPRLDSLTDVRYQWEPAPGVRAPARTAAMDSFPPPGPRRDSPTNQHRTESRATGVPRTLAAASISQKGQRPRCLQ